MNTTNFTLEYYNEKAESFVAGTRNVDFSALQNEFTFYVKKGGRILDLGCGSGRDSKAFLEMGYEVIAVDGSQELCWLASEYIGQEVICATFQEYDPEGIFDGIWACASLLHLRRTDLFSVMQELGKAMKSGAVLYASFKYGDREGERNGRYFTDFTPDGFREFMKMLPEFRLAEHWVTGDVRLGRGDERWLNMILERTEYQREKHT